MLLKHENHTKMANRWTESLSLTAFGSANPLSYLIQCFQVFYYLQLNIFLTVHSSYHVLFPKGALAVFFHSDTFLPAKHIS